MKRIFLLSLFVLGLGALTPIQYAAAQGYHDNSPELGNKPRPILAIRASFFSGIPDLAGISLSIKALRPFELEGGVATLGFGYTIYGRLGGSWTLYENRNEHGAGWDIQLLTLLGYRYIEGNLFSNTVSHTLTANVGFGFTYWLARHFGLEARVDLGGGYFLISDTTRDIPLYPDLRFSIGVAF